MVFISWLRMILRLTAFQTKAVEKVPFEQQFNCVGCLKYEEHMFGQMKTKCHMTVIDLLKLCVRPLTSSRIKNDTGK